MPTPDPPHAPVTAEHRRLAIVTYHSGHEHVPHIQEYIKNGARPGDWYLFPTESAFAQAFADLEAQAIQQGIRQERGRIIAHHPGSEYEQVAQLEAKLAESEQGRALMLEQLEGARRALVEVNECRDRELQRASKIEAALDKAHADIKLLMIRN